MKKIITEKGFTLTEILVVVFIIVLLSTLIFPNYRAGERQFAILRSTYKLAQDIRRAEEMAMSTKRLLNENIIPGGYGIYFKRRQGNSRGYDILLYADISTTQGRNERYDSNDREIEYLSLEKGVKVKSVMVGNSLPEKVSINFKPPDPTVKVKEVKDGGNEVEYSQIIITLSLENDESKTRIIKVNKVGLIDID